jgi:hypothetical protein
VKPTVPCLVVALLAAVAPAPARAGNEPEKAQRRLEENVLPKISREGAFLVCESTSYGYRTRDWCEDGVHRS